MRGLHIVVDGQNAAYRANVVTELYTRQGVRTSAIIGTLNIAHATIESLEKMYNMPVKECIFTWDRGHSPRRTEVFPEYKHNRKKEWTPEDDIWKKEFFAQVEVLHENLHLFGLKSYCKPQWEGDDIVLGFVEELSRQSSEDVSVIVSTDEDFHQLISSSVHVYSPIKKILYTPENYQELMGIQLENFLTYKILKGDSSDGIPGISGIGEKTAKSIVNKYGNLEGVLESSEELCKSKRTAAIFTKEGLEILDRNNKLINLKDYVDLSGISDDIRAVLSEQPVINHKETRDFLMKYQLTSILVKYKEWSVAFEDMSNNFNLIL